MTTNDEGAPVTTGRRARPAAGVGRGGRPTPAGWAFTFFMLAMMLTTVSLRSGAFEVPDSTLLAFTVAAWAPLLVRTYRPLLALAGTVLVESAHLALIPVVDPDAVQTVAMAAYQPVPLATLAAAFTVASRYPRRTGWVAGIGAGVVLGMVAMGTRPQSLFATDVVMVNLVMIATAVGALVAGRHDRIAHEAQEREDEKERAVIDERLRIARELHDVLAHNITLVNAQASVAHYLLRTDPEAAARALQNITTHSERAIDELRATVGLLRHGPDHAEGAGAAGDDRLPPVPDLDRLDDLVAGFRTAGAQIDLTVTGERRTLPPHGETAVHRIVQEALTNATKHAPRSPVRVALRWSPDDLQVWVANAPPVETGRRRPAPGTGHGLIGMRERALAAGGTFRSGRSADGGFVVAATIPVAATTLHDTPDARPDRADETTEEPTR
ncbi:sensor histidine kinase [Cellulomonas soli]|uniref:sensor histidine kinase n=1 Tax=Cellulomonas soli TaxID=931535 RepID=UPI003F877029